MVVFHSTQFNSYVSVTLQEEIFPARNCLLTIQQFSIPNTNSLRLESIIQSTWRHIEISIENNAI